MHNYTVKFKVIWKTVLTHWGRATHKCVGKLTIIGSDNGLSPGRRQAIIGTNAGILLIRTLGTNFSEILSTIHTFSFKKIHLTMSSGKWRPFCLGLNVLKWPRWDIGPSLNSWYTPPDLAPSLENINVFITTLHCISSGKWHSHSACFW